MTRAIVIGAGRGRRLMPLTDETPKCYAEIGGRRILDWLLEAFATAGLREVVFVGGYQIDRIRADYPGLSFRNNRDWANNNILASLFHAEDAMDDGFVCSYSDVLYRSDLVERLLAHPGDIVLGVDTEWRTRYARRRQHPEDDAEKVVARDGRVQAIGRDLPAAAASGEYVGVAKFSPAGAAVLRAHYRRAELGPKAYLIELFQRMLEDGVPIHLVETAGDYVEIDTTEDYELAREQWR